jgi:hypothetical protein
MRYLALFLISARCVFCAGKGELLGITGIYLEEARRITPITALGPPSAVRERAEQVVRSLAAAYPRRVTEVAYRNGDWAALVRGNWYYYADGRMLPENLRSKSEDYTPQPFYPYPEKLPAWKRPTADEAQRLSDAAKRRKNGGAVNRSLFFYDAIWNITDRSSAWEQVKTIKFLGKNILVHHGILEELSLVEQKINAAAKSDPKVKAWLDEVYSIAAWNWRNIADVQTRSNHAYGVAVDLLPQPKTYRSLETYWLWTSNKKKDWWNVPYSRRYHPPEAVISAFESYGFVWGGKWAFYDTMHFEYRPEILILNGITPSGEY